MELVSVIITTYKREPYILSRAINSVFNQTYCELELIIVNDYPDYSEIILDVIQAYHKNIIFINNNKNMGACYSRNIGVSKAKGKYVAFLDDDDEWTSNKLELQVRAMTESVGLVYCNGRGVKVIDNKKQIYSEKFSFIYNAEKDTLREILKGNCFGGTSYPLIRKDIFTTVGGFDLKFPASQDYDLWIRIAKVSKVRYIDEALVDYYFMEDSITSSIDKRMEGYFKLVEKHHHLFASHKKAAGCFFTNMLSVALHGRSTPYIIQTLNRSFMCFPNNLCLYKHLLYRGFQYINKSCKSKRGSFKMR